MKNHKTTEERKAMKRRIIAGIVAAFCCSTALEVISRMNRPEAEVINGVINEETISSTPETSETAVSTTNTTTHTTTTSTTDVTTTTSMTSTKATTSTTTTETDTILTTVETELQNEEPIIQENPEVIIHTEPTPIIQAAPATKEETTTSSTTTVSTTDEMTETNIETVTETVIETTYETSTEITEDETYLGYFRITGYVATGCKTASGTWPEAGRTVAMNATQRKNLGISFGDKIRIEGLGEYIVEDSGCKSGVIDVFCNSVSACYALTPHADVYLVKQ